MRRYKHRTEQEEPQELIIERCKVADFIAERIELVKYYIQKFNINRRNLDDLQSELISGFILDGKPSLIKKLNKLIDSDKETGKDEAMRLYRGIIYRGCKYFKLSQPRATELVGEDDIPETDDEEVIETICRADTLHMRQYLQDDRDRLIYDLFIIQSHSVNEVAEELGCHRNTARKYIKQMMSRVEGAWLEHSTGIAKIGKMREV